MELEVGDTVLCTVERIAGTVVFVKIEENGEGSIILSEIAPGRIRNLRDYVVPKKKIVCKILRVSGDRIDLSLRRVTLKERKEVIEKYKQERSYISILKSILKDKAEEIIKSVEKKEKFYDFLEDAKKNPKKLEKLVGKNDSKKILEILNAQKKKRAIVKKEISLTTTNPNGLELIKKILDTEKAEIKYISAGKYTIQLESSDLKKADQQLKVIIDEIEKKAKQKDVDFSVKEK